MVKVPLSKSWSLEHPERLNYIIANDDSYSQETYPHVAGLTLTRLRSNIQRTIMNRLRANNVDTSQMSAASFGFLTAGVTETAETLDTIMELLNNHMEVTDEDMIEALQLRESTIEDVGSAMADIDGYGRERFYVWSWPILVEDLYRLIEDWEEDELNPEEVYHWLSPFLLLPEEQRGKTCYIRYVGKSEYPSVPYKRFVTDSKQREGGLLCRFTTILERKFPDSCTAGRTFEFTKATLEAFAAPRLRDDRERFIIGFFGSDSLLNQQLGGYYGTYTPSSEDHTLFTSLET
ncbi:uncharacterized protein SPPG_04844 [Spizellomyces punctatus DAOM BR117]|uniref:Uncharacterized protein n=1 Tax=Spizellomyces punctatus (strain DAOM BR117) TaxID=645134 RepID=A0A0L0HI75_SPIPD|nr:uncharacterized protein SPPG_04844 [Spizellomyces punctatus DAOM BR117]KND00534.1 hypothetical protein SPPG_04844 [Spizellomyces punctatus DAOM BR117]|eukprot:XP_016608573.1 hypothetical protein SPPG_04844 [Spizellomyces punctatus DAOM BR117]